MVFYAAETMTAINPISYIKPERDTDGYWGIQMFLFGIECEIERVVDENNLEHQVVLL